MNKETLSTLIRAIGLTVGGSLVGNGKVTADELETFIGAAVVIISAAWTAWQRNRSKEAK